MFRWWGRTCSQSCLGSGTSDLKSILKDRNTKIKKNESEMWPGVNELCPNEIESIILPYIPGKIQLDTNIRIMPVLGTKFQADALLSYHTIHK